MQSGKFSNSRDQYKDLHITAFNTYAKVLHRKLSIKGTFGTHGININ